MLDPRPHFLTQCILPKQTITDKQLLPTCTAQTKFYKQLSPTCSKNTNFYGPTTFANLLDLTFFTMYTAQTSFTNFSGPTTFANLLDQFSYSIQCTAQTNFSGPTTFANLLDGLHFLIQCTAPTKVITNDVDNLILPAISMELAIFAFFDETPLQRHVNF